MIKTKSGPFQMPLAIFFLISTIEPFSYTISTSDHVLIFIQCEFFWFPCSPPLDCWDFRLCHQAT